MDVGARPEESMAGGTACFSVEGEFLTDLCRSFVTEGRWRHAMATLVEGLPGISTDQVMSILRGTHKLAGVNDLELTPEDRREKAESHEQLVAWQYAGLWRRAGGEMWRPYAVVTHLGREDVPDFSFSSQPDLWGRHRILHYADDSRADDFTEEGEALSCTGLAAVLWRRAHDVPLWLRGHDTARAALDEYLRLGHCLDERGAWDEGADGVRRPALREGKRSVDPLLDFDAIYEDLGVEISAADRITMALGVEGKMAEAVQAIFGEDDQTAPVSDPDCSAESGYILPDGRFYGCPYMHHGRLAERLLRHEFNVEVEDPQKEADNRNWLRIQASAFVGSTPVGSGYTIMSPKGRPTKRQKVTLVTWCITHETPYPDDLA